MARYVAQLIALGVQTVAKAFSQALRQEYQAAASARRAAEEAGRDGRRAAKASSYTGMSLHEARQILNVQDITDMETTKKNYEHLFKVNTKADGGSFYLQSKVVRAKERIELELGETIAPDPSSQTTSETADSETGNSKPPS